MVLLFLESIGTTELLVILVVALVVFGPRRLPEIGRKIGKGMAEFRRASDDFKRTWEREVEMERTTPERVGLPERAAGSTADAPDNSALMRDSDVSAAAAAGPFVMESAESVARGRRTPAPDAADAGSQFEPATPANEQIATRPEEQPTSKAEWL
jgi:sec-independent protein translocase protein TatB